MLKSEVDAEEVEKKAKEELKNKNYETAFALFDEARKAYEEINLKGKSGFCEKQLVLIKRMMDYTKNAKEPLFDKSKVFKSESERNKTLIEAEKRRNRLRQQSEIGIKEADLEQKYKRKIQLSNVQINKEYENRQGKLRIIQMKQEEKQKLQEKANRALDQAKMSVDDKEFKKAKTHYNEALDIFKEIGWFDQVDVLYKEIKNLDRYETEHLRKLDTEEVSKQQKKEEFEERVSGIIEEQKYLEQKRLALLEDLTPEMKKDLEKAKMLKEKAEKEISQNKLQRAIGRYKYKIEIYKSIPIEKVDLLDKISEIEKIITDLEAKM